jgi:hypothetical protein
MGDLVGNGVARRSSVHIERVREGQPVLPHQSALSGHWASCPRAAGVNAVTSVISLSMWSGTTPSMPERQSSLWRNSTRIPISLRLTVPIVPHGEPFKHS